MKCLARSSAVLIASLLTHQAHADVIGVKSLAGPPTEFADHQLPTTKETMIPSNILVLDRMTSAVDGKAAATQTSNFSTSAGVGFTIVQVTSNYPSFSPTTFTGPSGTQYHFNGSTITCQSGPCGQYQADLRMEPFSNQSGGMIAFSISGGEVPTGSWQAALQEPLPLPFSSPVEVDSVIAFDENEVEVGLPDPCLYANGERIPICEIPQFQLVGGTAPTLSVGFRGAISSDFGKSDRLELSALQIRVIDTKTLDAVYQFRHDPRTLESLEVDTEGRTLLRLPGLSAGEYSVRLDIEGFVEGVGQLERTAYYFLPVLEQSHALTDNISTEIVDQRRLEIRLGLEELTANDTHLYAYGELWSRTSNRPVAWIGGMTYPETAADGSLSLPMMLDARWLALAGEQGSQFELRNVRIQDPDTFIPLDIKSELSFEVARLPIEAYMPSASVEQDESLFEGAGDVTIPRFTADYDAPDQTLGMDPTGLFLVHGWCSTPAWPQWDFINPGRVGGTAEFNDSNQSRSHDNFAQRIRDQGATHFTDAFSVVAHSQGGAAATHLRAYYSSLLDNITAPRRIQSMGTPYGGSTLMDYYLATGPLGWLISEIFGFCGPQFSLGTLGSVLWKASLPTSAKQQVHYYRTRHRRPSNFWQRLQFWRWKCNIASYVIPGSDDGVVATYQGTLSNAHDRGLTDGECHTGGMKYADQKDNESRNDTMDALGRPAPPPPPPTAPFARCHIDGNGFSFWADASDSSPGPAPISYYNFISNGTMYPNTTSTTFHAPPGDGTYFISVRVTDTAGNTATTSCGFINQCLIPDCPLLTGK